MAHTLLRPFMLIGGIALFIVILLGDTDAGTRFAVTMSEAVIDIARAIGTAVMQGIFSPDAGVDPSAVTPPAAG